MKMRTLRPGSDSLGEWQAFAEDGQNQDERRLRLNSAPEHLKNDILKHLQLVFKMRAK